MRRRSDRKLFCICRGFDCYEFMVDDTVTPAEPSIRSHRVRNTSERCGEKSWVARSTRLFRFVWNFVCCIEWQVVSIYE